VGQLNLLNDVGFSASSNYKIVVPKSGSVMFVMFIPSKQYEQGWWTQKCAQSTVLNKPQDHTPEKKPESQSGIDLDAAKKACQSSTTDGTGPQLQDRNPRLDSEKTPKNKSKKTGLARTRYEDWSPTADAIFRELALTVVSGIHTQEESQTTPALSQIECPADAYGNMDLNKAVGDMLTCSLTGQNLNKVAKLKLVNAKDSTDPAIVQGAVTVSGDDTKGTVAFPVAGQAGLGALNKPEYKIYTVTKEGIESSTNQTSHFGPNRPVLADIAPPSLDLAKDKLPVTVSLTGYHLDQAATVRLAADSPAKFQEISLSNASSNSASFTLKATDSVLQGDFTASPLILKLTLLTKDKTAEPVATAKQLTVKGKLIAPAPKIPPKAKKITPIPTPPAKEKDKTSPLGKGKDKTKRQDSR